MSRGQPDFGAYAATATIAKLADMGELAARLGSIVTLDRRGDVVFLDDFEAPILNWYDTTLAPREIRLYPDKAFMGSQSVYLKTTDDLGSYTFMDRRFHLTPGQSYGLEIKLHQLLADAIFNIELYIYTGTRSKIARWRYDAVAEKLYTWHTGEDYKEIASGIKAANIRDEWYPMKLVIDGLNFKYVRGLFLGEQYDLSDELMQDGESIVSPCISATVEVKNATGEATAILVDNLIITQNEP